jgi:hypothetical protein
LFGQPEQGIKKQQILKKHQEPEKSLQLDHIEDGYVPLDANPGFGA